jgi:hypothetical protein
MYHSAASVPIILIVRTLLALATAVDDAGRCHACLLPAAGVLAWQRATYAAG